MGCQHMHMALRPLELIIGLVASQYIVGQRGLVHKSQLAFFLKSMLSADQHKVHRSYCCHLDAGTGLQTYSKALAVQKLAVAAKLDPATYSCGVSAWAWLSFGRLVIYTCKRNLDVPDIHPTLCLSVHKQSKSIICRAAYHMLSLCRPPAIN